MKEADSHNFQELYMFIHLFNSSVYFIQSN